MEYIIKWRRLPWHTFLCSIIFGTLISKSCGIYGTGVWNNGKINSQLTKLQLTQKGYIQFLRYVEDVPAITEYTFCIWVKSHDLSHSHPLVSYSRNEKERLIRVWITPRGKSLNLELQGQPVFEIPTNFREHQWYHVCQSWDSASAVWELFINDKKFRGIAPELTGLVIGPGGDLVVAQEYTDFNKGLEDGIEGEIFGFNFVLSATSKTPKHSRYVDLPIRPFEVYRQRRSFSPSRSRYHDMQFSIANGKWLSNPSLWGNSYSSSLESIHENNIFLQKTPGGRTTIHPLKSISINPSNELFPFQTYLSSDNVFRRDHHKSTGLMLVEASRNCRIGKGGPLRGEKVLINWAETKVRVFGGAIIKHVVPFC